MRKVLVAPFVAAALAAVIGLAGCGGSAKSSGEAAAKTVTVTTPIDQAPSAQTATVEGAPTAPDVTNNGTNVGIGQSAKDGVITFKAESIQVENSIPVAYSDPIKAPAGAKMVVARVTYRNDGKVKVDPFCGGSGAVLIDNQDRNFEFDSFQAIMVDGNKICEGIQPGFKATEVLPFMVPQKAQIVALALWDNSDMNDYNGSNSFVRVRR